MISAPKHFDPAEADVISLRTLMTVGERAAAYAHAVHTAAQCQQALTDGYKHWREENGCYERIEPRSIEWIAMMDATTELYRQLQAAKARERRTKKKLVDFVMGEK